MKQLYTLVIGICLSVGIAQAQIFSDNFDSYTAGDYLGLSNPTWSTWSNQPGGAEDVKISDADASSAPNSLYFKATSANGGPQDVILKFDDVYTSGNFILDFDMKVVSGTGAYFNLQQNHVVGQVWALQGYFLQDGTFKFDNGNTGDILLTGSYPNGSWCNVKLEVNLTTNLWEVKIDNVSAGTFSNPVNSMGIWDIYPVNPASMGGNGQSEFYIDNVSYNHIPASLPNLNAGVTYIKPLQGLSGQTIPVEIKVRNLGQDPITSFDINYTYVGGVSVSESVSSVNIASLDTYDHIFTTKVTLVSGTNPFTVTVSNVNGLGQDDEASDDAKTINVTPTIPAAGKVVVGEEATGTWCQWCPRGAVFMDMMADKYEGFWAGIAVHNNDPMAVTDYDAGMGTKIQGYPSALVDRGAAIDPSALEDDFVQRILIAPKAVIVNGAEFDASTRNLDVTLTFTANATMNGMKVACVLTEDGVTGTAPGYAQANAYAGGGSGVMGGYESLPSTVPASQMVYDHVARVIKPSFNGGSGLIPNGVAAGESYTVCFNFTLPAAWNIDNMNIVGILFAANGRIDNGSISTVNEAITNGLVDCGSSAGIESEVLYEDQTVTIYPNPAQNFTNIVLNLKGQQNVQVDLVDMTGKVIGSRDYGMLDGGQQITLPTLGLEAGIYLVNVRINNQLVSKRLIVE
ncbi:MAG: Omp28-related outer membrane protein [Brumimicrobium sp.]|nr:Omp28-related outer membrane protein [Brumimicrobium sp.]